MKLFSPTERCAKCGSVTKIHKYINFVGVLKIICTTCGYKFNRKSLDRSK